MGWSWPRASDIFHMQEGVASSVLSLLPVGTVEEVVTYLPEFLGSWEAP